MTLDSLARVSCVGAGKMGGALVEGWLARGLKPQALTLIDPAPPDAIAALARRSGIRLLTAPPEDETAGVLLLAVKPQIMGKVLTGLSAHVGADTLVLSIAAGKTIADIASSLAVPAAVIRAMPNTPAAIGLGMTVLVADRRTREAQRQVASALMQAVGETAWIDDEALMDAVTAVSGSGPAYVFHLAECLAAAGEEAGLPAEVAAQLARQTVAGAGGLLAASPDDAATLRRNVTSPGGTTEAALQVLMTDDGLAPLLRRAVEAAVRRGRELSG